MTAVFKWLSLVAVATLSGAGCNVFNPPADDFDCETQADCTLPRTCQMGLCVLSADVPDANPNAPDADPNAPDADPNAPDADPNAPDADPNAPDATPLPDAAPPSDADPACGLQQPILGSATDNFSDGLALPLWEVNMDGSASVVETGGELVIDPGANDPSGSSAGYNRALVEDMTGKRAFVEVTQMVSTSTPLVTAGLSFLKNQSNKVVIEQKSGTLTFSTFVSGTQTVEGTASFSAATHRWWQLRESGGTVFGEVSTDGINWSILGSATSPAFLSSGRIELRGATDDSVPSPGTLRFDNYNGGGIVCP